MKKTTQRRLYILALITFTTLGIFYIRSRYLEEDIEIRRLRAENTEIAMEITRLNHQLWVSRKMLEVAACESGLNHQGVYGDGGLAYGLTQPHKTTFDELASKAGFKGFFWKNPYNQLAVLKWSIENGYGNKWSCFKED